MPLYRPRREEYIEAVRALRQGVEDPITGKPTGRLATGFDASDGYDIRKFSQWTPAQKAKITRIYNVVDALMARPFTIWRGRSPRNIRRVQEAAGHTVFPPEIRVAFIPSPANIPPSVKVTRKRIIIKHGPVTHEAILFSDFDISPSELAGDAEGYTRAVIEASPPARIYKVKCGEYETTTAWDAEGAIGEVGRMVNVYNPLDHDPLDPNSHYYGNWLNGVEAYSFDRLADYEKFARAQARSRRAQKEERERLRKIWRKKHGHRRPPHAKG